MLQRSPMGLERAGWVGLLALACAGAADEDGDAASERLPSSPAEARGPSGNVLDVDRGLDFAVPPAPSEDSLVVTTTSGPLRGIASGGVEQFLGIPYAAPPLGALRFAPPAPPAAWTGVRDATLPGAVCPQPTFAGVFGSEDCLSLNIHRPLGLGASERRPVMVWIHGGSFISGAGSGYDPRRLVESSGSIVVTINYRLGALGFLALPALTAESPDGLSGDYGLMDQQAALRWVRDNIAAFGGDPGQVTIQGQSAGGASVCAQLASPPAAGLFARAVIQSASCASAPLALAEGQGTVVATALGCGDATSAAACLRELSAEQLIAGQAGAVFGPIVGGTLLPAAPYAVVAAGAQHRVPVLVGGVSDEMRGFAALEYPLDAAGYPAALAAHFPALPVDAIAAEYPLEDYPEPYLALTAALSDSGAYLGGALGGCVTATLADTFAASTPTYAYELDDANFTWAAGAIPIPVPRGASHSSDLAYLFEPVGFVLSEPFAPEQAALAAQMVSAWGSFIQNGDPNAPGASDWPRYDAAERRMLHFEPGAVSVSTDFRERHRCEFWRQIRSAAAAGP